MEASGVNGSIRGYFLCSCFWLWVDSELQFIAEITFNTAQLHETYTLPKHQTSKVSMMMHDGLHVHSCDTTSMLVRAAWWQCSGAGLVLAGRGSQAGSDGGCAECK